MTKKIAIWVAVGFFILQCILATRVGMSWDEPSSFFMGRANLKFWLTGNRQYVTDFQNKALFKDSPIQYIYGEDIYPPFPFVIASLTSYIFAEKIPIFNVFDAHHFGEILIGSVGVWAMIGVAVEAGLSTPIAIVTGLVYGLFPTIFQMMRNDAKDIPLMSMIAVSAYFFLLWMRAWQAKDYKHALIRGLLFAITLGLAEATKPTAAIFVPIALVWILLSVLRSASFRKKMNPWGKWAIHGVLFAVVAIGMFLLAWPWLWDDPVGKLMGVFTFFRRVGFAMPVPYFGQMYLAGINVPKTYPWVVLFMQSPLELIFFAILGTVYAITVYIKKGTVIPLLFVIWFFAATSRFLIPGVIIYARIRHFIDAMPAFFILVGFGMNLVANDLDRISAFFANKYQRVIPKRIGLWIVAGITIVHLLVISIRFFPYEMNYYNMVIGDAKTIEKKGLFDFGFADSTREAMEYINRQATIKGEPVYVYACGLAHMVRLYASPRVKITLDPTKATYALAPNSVSWYGGPIDFGKKHHETAYTVRRGGIDTFYVFRHLSPIGYQCGGETATNYED